jgi:hypothetical protein
MYTKKNTGMENYVYDSTPIRTGDTVWYKGGVYFIRKNGTTCYLYKSEEDLRQKRNKVFTPSVRSVQKITRKQSPSAVDYSYYQSSPFLNRMEESAASETVSSEGYSTALTTEEEEQLLALLSRLTVEEKERILLRDSQITGSW